MKTFIYPAIFIKDKEEENIKVFFPDLDISTDGDMVEEAYLYAKECLKAYFICVEKYDFEFNLPTDYETVNKTINKDEYLMLIDATITEKDLK